LRVIRVESRASFLLCSTTITVVEASWANIHAGRHTPKMKLLAVPGGILTAALGARPEAMSRPWQRLGEGTLVLAVWASPFKSKSRLAAENAALRHQLIVLRRKLRGRVQLANSDRWFLVQLYRWFQIDPLAVMAAETAHDVIDPGLCLRHGDAEIFKG
jgi:hypothetical protein